MIEKLSPGPRACIEIPFPETLKEAPARADYTMKTGQQGTGSLSKVAYAVIIILSLYVTMYALVAWFDWRLCVAWVLYGVIKDMREEFKQWSAGVPSKTL